MSASFSAPSCRGLDTMAFMNMFTFSTDGYFYFGFLFGYGENLYPEVQGDWGFVSFELDAFHRFTFHNAQGQVDTLNLDGQ